MEYLQFNDELTNSIHTKRHEDYWDLYLPEFEDQIETFIDDYEWAKAKGAVRELWKIADRFPKKWWALALRYRRLSNQLREDIEFRYNAEITELENE